MAQAHCRVSLWTYGAHCSVLIHHAEIRSAASFVPVPRYESLLVVYLLNPIQLNLGALWALWVPLGAKCHIRVSIVRGKNDSDFVLGSVMTLDR